MASIYTSQTNVENLLKSILEQLIKLGTNSIQDGYFLPESAADADAPLNSIYYSTTASKLVYKDSGGVVNNLY